MIDGIKKIILRICFWMCSIFKINHQKVVAVNFYGKGYGDSGKYIFDKLYSKNSKLDLVWLAKDPKRANVPRYVRAVKYNSLKAIFELATAKVWIDNHRKRPYVHKRKKQFYLQTWHSNLRLKKIEKDAEKYLPKSYVKMAKHDSRLISAVVVGCDFSYDTIKNSFWYDGPIYKTGIPRCDELFNMSPESVKKTKKALNIPTDCKVFLYAPTFRKDKNIDTFGLDAFSEKIAKLYSGKAILLVRFHPGSKQSIDESRHIKDVTKFPNMQNLISASDVLITDYSGSMFDAAISHKPCILYTPDYKEYLKNERELYFDFDELPFINTHTLLELEKAIATFDRNNYDKKVDSFLKKVGCVEKGKSAKNVANLLEKKVWGKNV